MIPPGDNNKEYIVPVDISLFDNMTVDALEAKRNAAVRDNDADPLIESLSDSTHINAQKKESLIHLAHLFLANMKENLLKDQFDLATVYSNTTPDEWADFLQDRVVSTYIKKHKNTLLKLSAERNLADPYAKNKRDNLTLMKNIKDEEKEDKELVVIMRLPDKYAD